MTVVHINGKLYRITPGGLVFAAYSRPSQPEQGILWRRLSRGSALSTRVLVEAGLAEPQKTSSTRLTKKHLYAIS